MGMVGTIGVPTRDFRLVALRSMTEEMRYITRWIRRWRIYLDNMWAKGHEAAIGMTWNDFKALLVEEFCLSNEMERLENEFWNHKMVGANHAAYTYPFHELAKLVPHPMTLESARIKRAFNVNVNAVEDLQDPKVVTGTFSLNDYFANVLFDSGADFSFISTKFAPLLNVKPSIVNPGYVIEVADGTKVEVDRIIRDYKLELGNSLFSINLIPLGQGSFDVIVGMDWFSQNKAVIVCHEKVVEIRFEGSGILRVQEERTLRAAKALMNAKVDEPKLSDIFVVRDFVDVFPEDLSGLPPQRQVEFRIDLVPRATPIYSKSKEEHEIHLRLVLELLKKEKLYAKSFKCEFWLQEVHFLGHVVNQNGIYVDPSKANVVTDTLSRKERLKPRRVRAMAMTIQSGVRGMILAAQGEAFKQENILAEKLHGLDQQMERKEEESLYFMDRI
ncbi:putative reverse transcriptase domain-containing protein [Tanacetum coccineum]|uniref:Reverse transcriptase domain-containing protein n=1 Tax=Tanacetum coccineum TaxID=301880 RepID=A0ABQ5CAI1_9ASTR